ncbi:MAG: hypothetical protein JOZ76_24045 [Bradyrhizobium sp.]|nr:hypothetical protein [Bradyrhizobium sp.]
MASALQFADDLELSRNVLPAQQNMLFRFFQMLLGQPEVHLGSVRLPYDDTTGGQRPTFESAA